MSPRLLVVVADDFGLTQGTSRAIIETFRSGIVTATSALVTAPGFDSSASMLKDEPDLEVGLHGALVGEDPPLSSATEIPTLVDRKGRLARSWRDLLVRLAAGRVDPSDVDRELRAQLDRLRGAGLVVTHLNLHQHLQLWPTLRAVVIDMCRDVDIPYVRTPSSRRPGPRGALLRKLAAGLADDLRSSGLATNEGFAGLDQAGEWNATRLEGALNDAVGSVVEINLHPGADQDPERSRYTWDYAWSSERTALTGQRARSAVEGAGFTLVGPRGVPMPTADRA